MKNKNNLSPQEYYKRKHRKRISAGVIFFNEKKEVLVVKPNYRKGWIFPGGNVELDESPREGAIRETKEEINLDFKECELLCIDYNCENKIKGEKLQFLFSGGTLTQKNIKGIKLQKEELDEYKFIKTKDASKFLDKPNLKRFIKCIEAIKNNQVIYLENGE